MNQSTSTFILQNALSTSVTNIINNCLHYNPLSVIFYIFYIIIIGLCGYSYYTKRERDDDDNYNYYLLNKIFLFIITFNFFYCYFPVTFVKDVFLSNTNLLFLLMNGTLFSGSIILYYFSSMEMPHESAGSLFIIVLCGLLLSILCIFFTYFTLGNNFIVFSFVTSDINKCIKESNRSFKCNK